MTADWSATFFGLPLVLRRNEAITVASDLERLFRRQLGPHGQLAQDLAALAVFFDPLRTGSAIRNRLRELPDAPPPESRLVRAPLVIGSGRNVLVTPEGRVALEVLLERLRATPEGDRVIALDPEQSRDSLGLVYDHYRSWALGRLSAVIGLLEGTAEPLRPLSIAWLLFLLINGSRSPETAVTRPKSPSDEERLDEALGSILSAFVGALDHGATARDFHLYQGWVVTEARRRSSHLLGKDSDKSFVIPGRETDVLSLVVRELRTRRRPPGLAQTLAAFDALVESYREHLPVLAGLGLAHERRAETRSLREALEAGYAADPQRP